VAQVTDNFNFLTSYQPFERPPDAETLYSLIPRGIRRFFLATDTTLKAINDVYTLHVTATLPDGFAYVPRSLNVSLAVDRATDFRAFVAIRLFNHIAGQELGTAEWAIADFEFWDPGSTTAARILQNPNLVNFAQPIWALHTGSPTARITMYNTNATAAAAGFVTTHWEFYEYDLTQAQRFWVNTPIPTIGR